jgi:DNA-binding response OmpR family regulator
MTKEILLIDDDLDELEVFADAIASIDKNIKCSQVKSQAEAMDYLKYSTPSFIFIDFNMPATNGLDCLMELRKLSKLENTGIILYSNHISEQMQFKAMNLGATGCMKKPNTISVLAQKLNHILGNSRRPETT